LQNKAVFHISKEEGRVYPGKEENTPFPNSNNSKVDKNKA
jgi:hypothetical protein